MSAFKVIRKLDGVVVYSFDAEAKTVWDQFPESDFTYEMIPDAGQPPVLNTVFGGRRKLTHLEFRSLLHTDEQENIDEFEATFEANVNLPYAAKKRIRTTMKKYNEATIIDLDEPDIELGLGLYVSLGVMSYSRIAEVLNG